MVLLPFSFITDAVDILGGRVIIIVALSQRRINTDIA